MKTVNVAIEFYPRLANRDQHQGDGAYNAVLFRMTYLSDLDTEEAWNNTTPYIIFNFQDVKKIGPSFANEAFAYFTRYARPEAITKRILFTNITNVQRAIIETELQSGYSRFF